VRKVKATERRQALLEVLCSRRSDKVENLAFEFGVCRSTIKNDVLELSLSYPIYSLQGNGGGVFVADDYYLGKQYLKPSQQELIERLISTSAGDDLKTLQSILKQFGHTESDKKNNKEIKTMPTLKEIRDDLKDVRFYYSKKNSLDNAFENVVVNDVFDKVNKYNDAVKSAPVRLYDIYLGLYVQNNTQFALSEELGYTPDYIRRLNRKLCEYFQKVFAKEKCSGHLGEGGDK
jgi:Predicted transcriptional regulator